MYIDFDEIFDSKYVQEEVKKAYQKHYPVSDIPDVEVF